MREILFRAKRTDNGEWINGYYVRQDETSYCFKEDYESHPENTKHYIAFDMQTDWGLPNRHLVTEIDPETLCQYTGLTDKNGNPIWENDIVKCNKRKDGFELYKVLWRKYYADFGVEPLDFGVQYPISLGENEQDIKGCNYEIIGNIFDNPELLKGE